MMQQWRVEYTQQPTQYNRRQYMLVEAEGRIDAMRLAAHHLAGIGPVREGDKGYGQGIYYSAGGYSIDDAEPYLKPELPAGRVIGRVA
jgi:hypothetical protein